MHPVRSVQQITKRKHTVFCIIAVCIYRLVMISIDLSEITHFEHCQSETKSETIFFLTKIFFSNKIFLGFFLGLNFVSDYILQLYFVCNNLIKYLVNKNAFS